MPDFPSWPAWRFHESCPGGQIFESAEDVPEGWVDSPAKLKAEEPNIPDETPAMEPAAPRKPGRPRRAE